MLSGNTMNGGTAFNAVYRSQKLDYVEKHILVCIGSKVLMHLTDDDSYPWTDWEVIRENTSIPPKKFEQKMNKLAKMKYIEVMLADINYCRIADRIFDEYLEWLEEKYGERERQRQEMFKQYFEERQH